jgi:hypothetical protein
MGVDSNKQGKEKEGRPLGRFGSVSMSKKSRIRPDRIRNTENRICEVLLIEVGGKLYTLESKSIFHQISLKVVFIYSCLFRLKELHCTFLSLLTHHTVGSRQGKLVTFFLGNFGVFV